MENKEELLARKLGEIVLAVLGVYPIEGVEISLLGDPSYYVVTGHFHTGQHFVKYHIYKRSLLDVPDIGDYVAYIFKNHIQKFISGQNDGQTFLH